MEKVHSEHVHDATLVNATGTSAEDDSFFLGPSNQNRFFVMATTSHEAKAIIRGLLSVKGQRVERRGA